MSGRRTRVVRISLQEPRDGPAELVHRGSVGLAARLTRGAQGLK